MLKKINCTININVKTKPTDLNLADGAACAGTHTQKTCDGLPAVSEASGIGHVVTQKPLENKAEVRKAKTPRRAACKGQQTKLIYVSLLSVPMNLRDA